jgi:hypothetical protein
MCGVHAKSESESEAGYYRKFKKERKRENCAHGRSLASWWLHPWQNFFLSVCVQVWALESESNRACLFFTHAHSLSLSFSLSISLSLSDVCAHANVYVGAHFGLPHWLTDEEIDQGTPDILHDSCSKNSKFETKTTKNKSVLSLFFPFA